MGVGKSRGVGTGQRLGGVVMEGVVVTEGPLSSCFSASEFLLCLSVLVLYGDDVVVAEQAAAGAPAAADADWLLSRDLSRHPQTRGISYLFGVDSIMCTKIIGATPCRNDFLEEAHTAHTYIKTNCGASLVIAPSSLPQLHTLRLPESEG